MDLFDHIAPQENLLPRDGDVRYHGVVIGQSQADRFFERLLVEIAWAHDELVMFGRPVITRRKVAWYGNRPFAYTYSRATKQAQPWVPVLADLKELAERCSGERYNTCLLNLYHSGEEAMGWHSDAEGDLKKQGAIASLSFGAPRRFAFRHKQSKEQVKVMLEHGSLLVMKGVTQSFWQHALPTMKTVRSPRINLTFRTIVAS
ncbi:alpha-ketoglutarate-dependent dioxygenase AlkB family protein [Marinobacter salexigens]|uniref:alpha-ketoglutarate-dependent dioxygenase AlkB family protein n=1 Tax=Marinobacter salexigens TaxID=1925763 RepID=UPI000C28F7BE|nr:alpha-ketoglutarate-dependent dioxygenase AlkB [Marinobacter salexigens]